MGRFWVNLIRNLMRNTKKLVFNSENRYFLIYAIFVKPDPNIGFSNFSRNDYSRKNIFRLLLLYRKLKLRVSISIYRIAGTCIFVNFSPFAQSQEYLLKV